MTKHRKPRGIPHHYHGVVDGKPGSIDLNKRLLALPDEKAAIERVIAEKFSQDMKGSDLRIQFLGPPVQNEENDIDFAIESSEGPLGLELVEFAPLANRTFEGVHATEYRPVDRATAVTALIAAKNEKYTGCAKWLRKMLLFYVTHNAFSLDPFSIATLKLQAARRNRVFHHIAYYKPMEAVRGIVQRIFPITMDEFKEFSALRVPKRITPIFS
jgi:hypothetical protein